MPASRFNNGDVISGAVLAGLGGYVVFESNKWVYLGPDGPGPGFFPIWYGIIMILLSLAVMAGGLRRNLDKDPEPTKWSEVGRALIAWAGLAVCIALLKLLGFAVAFALFTFFIVSVMYRRPVRTGILTGVGTSFVFYLIFPLALDVRLPVGMFGF